jgi:hypothetical protein
VGPRFPGRRLAASSRCAPRCPAETVHRCSPRSSAPWPSRSSRRGVWSGSGPLVLAVCSVRVRATEVSLRAFASPPIPSRRPVWSGSSGEQALLTRCARFRPGWLLGPVCRPPVRVLPRPGCRSHRGRVRRAAPRKEWFVGPDCAHGRAASRRLDRSRLLASSARCPGRPSRPSTEVSVRSVRPG